MQKHCVLSLKKQSRKLSSSKLTKTRYAKKIIKNNSNMFAHILYQIFSKLTETSKFISELISPDLTLVFKKEDRTNKYKYRLFSILPTFSKVFERYIYNKFLCILLTYYSNPRKIQENLYIYHCLMNPPQRWKQFLCIDVVFRELITDLSKAFNCLSHKFQA